MPPVTPYIAGQTFDPGFPATPGAFQPEYNGSAMKPVFPVEPSPSDGFVAKLNPAGTAMVWATFLGGASDDAVRTIALGLKGSVYVSGTTTSSDFPVTTGAPAGGDFITVLNSTGSAATFSARFPDSTVSHAMAVDPDGRVLIADPAGVVSSITLTQPLPPRVFRIANAAGGPFTAAVAPTRSGIAIRDESRAGPCGSACNPMQRERCHRRSWTCSADPLWQPPPRYCTYHQRR